MSPAAPDPTPEGTLIRTARKAAGVKIQDAANATNGVVSATRWSQIETGREPRRGQVVQARGGDTTLAHMAAVVGITASQLAEAGRKDAAEVLSEIQRQQRVAGGASRFGSAALAATSGLVISGEVVPDRALTRDGYPIPPIPADIELPRMWDATSLPLHEVQIWLIRGATIEERAGMVGWLRRRRQEERDAAAALRESNGSD